MPDNNIPEIGQNYPTHDPDSHLRRVIMVDYTQIISVKPEDADILKMTPHQLMCELVILRDAVRQDAKCPTLSSRAKLWRHVGAIEGAPPTNEVLDEMDEMDKIRKQTDTPGLEHL